MEQSNVDLIREIIGHECECITCGEVKAEMQDLLSRFIDLAEQSYVLIQWSDSQELMDEPWFDEEAILDVEGKFGSSAYFVPLIRIL